MAGSYSLDLRDRVLRACEAGGESQTSIARRFEVSQATVSTWRRQAHDQEAQRVGTRNVRSEPAYASLTVP